MGADTSSTFEAGFALLGEGLEPFGSVVRGEAVERIALELEAQAGVDAAVVGPQRVHHVLRVRDRERALLGDPAREREAFVEQRAIGDGHLNFGQMGGGGVLTLLPRVIGKSRAAELIFSGEFLSAGRAVEWGLASRVVADGALLDEGLAFARRVAEKSPLAIANAKHVMNTLWADNGSVDASLRYELERDAFYCLTSHDAPEGLQAFSEKRKPRFKGR